MEKVSIQRCRGRETGVAGFNRGTDANMMTVREAAQRCMANGVVGCALHRVSTDAVRLDAAIVCRLIERNRWP